MDVVMDADGCCPRTASASCYMYNSSENHACPDRSVQAGRSSLRSLPGHQGDGTHIGEFSNLRITWQHACNGDEAMT